MKKVKLPRWLLLLSLGMFLLGLYVVAKAPIHKRIKQYQRLSKVPENFFFGYGVFHWPGKTEQEREQIEKNATEARKRKQRALWRAVIKADCDVNDCIGD